MAQITVTVNGRNYRMACDDGEEDHLARLGRRFDETVEELRAGLGEVGDQRLMVMAGILTADRLDEAERRLRAVEIELEGIKDTRRDALHRYESLEEGFIESLESAADRIERLAQRLRSVEEGTPPNGDA